MKIRAWFSEGGRVSLRINSVAADAILTVNIDGAEAARSPLLNVDGKAVVNHEINREIVIPVPAGKHEIEITHDGNDWVNLDSVRLQRVLPAAFSGGWTYHPESIGLSNGRTAVVYILSPHVAWPASALRQNPPIIANSIVRIEGWNQGNATAEWMSPETGTVLSKTTGTMEGGILTLSVPAFRDDLVAIIR